MKPIMRTFGLLACVSVCAALLIPQMTGCTHVQVVGQTTNSTGVVTFTTNTVTTIDPVKIQKASVAIQPAVSSVIRRVILNSPQHSVQIAGYARAVGSVFLAVKMTGKFSPAEVTAAMDAATQPLQANAPSEIIDAKNAALALYTILFDDQLTVNVPANGWPMTVCQLFVNAIDQALKDAGQPGVPVPGI